MNEYYYWQGGSWCNGQGLARCAYRSWFRSKDLVDYLGFRLVLIQP